MKNTIYIIDDDSKLNNLLISYLDQYNFACTAFTHPEDALRALGKNLPDLVILDVMLPGMDGFEVCRRIRRDHTVPVIMLTARGEVSDRIVGLELGADDYLPKPFEPRELVARIQSILRRTADAGKQARQKFGPLEINHHRRAATLHGKDLELTTTEFSILSLLAKHAGRAMGRDEIFEKVKGLDSESFDRAIDVAVSRLRAKLEDDPKSPRYLRTVWGTGYMFIGRDGDEKD